MNFILPIFLFIIIEVVLFVIYYLDLSQNSVLKVIYKQDDTLFKSRIMREKYNVDCKLLFEDDDSERNKSTRLMRELRGDKREITLLDDSNFIFDASKCSLFRKIRGYDRHKISNFETQFPLAYTILVDKNVEQFERLLRVIYRPQNVYCIHVDIKSAVDVKRAIESIVECFDNVFLPTKNERVVYAHFSLLKAQLNCMGDLLNLDNLINVEKHPRLTNKKVIKWKYWLNSPGTFLPIRTNLEITRILNMYNGTSDVEIHKIHPNPDRIYTVVKLQSDDWVYSSEIKSSPPYNFSILKGSNYIAASRLFVDYIINSEFARNLTAWSMDTRVPVILIIHKLIYGYFED
jgi:hypothetical protein